MEAGSISIRLTSLEKGNKVDFDNLIPKASPLFRKEWLVPASLFSVGSASGGSPAWADPESPYVIAKPAPGGLWQSRTPPQLPLVIPGRDPGSISTPLSSAFETITNVIKWFLPL